MWKGAMFGILLFVLLAYLLYPYWVRSMGIPKGTQFAISPSVLFYNPLFWSVLFFSLSVGMGIAGYWKIATWQPPQ